MVDQKHGVCNMTSCQRWHTLAKSHFRSGSWWVWTSRSRINTNISVGRQLIVLVLGVIRLSSSILTRCVAMVVQMSNNCLRSSHAFSSSRVNLTRACVSSSMMFNWYCYGYQHWYSMTEWTSVHCCDRRCEPSGMQGTNVFRSCLCRIQY